MEPNIAEAITAKEIAERRFAAKDFVGAKTYALKAKSLCPGLEGLSQMVATFQVYMASEVKSNGEIDYYSVLGLNPTGDRDAVKKQYRKMAVLLHPDKNKTSGADGAFKLVSEAWTVLSDSLKRKKQYSSMLTPGVVAGYSSCSGAASASASHGLDSFWTVCTSCQVRYEYLRKYVNKRLSCKNCRGTFVAVETGTAPVTGSFPYSSWSYLRGNGYGSHGYDGASYGGSGLHTTTHAYDYASNDVSSFHWGSYSGTSSVLCPNTETCNQVNGKVRTGRKVKSASKEKPSPKPAVSNVSTIPAAKKVVTYLTKAGKPDKRRKIVVGADFRNGYDPLNTGNGVSHTYEYAPSNVSPFQWGSYSGTSNGASAETFNQDNRNGRKVKSASKEKPSPKPALLNGRTTPEAKQVVSYLTKAGKPDKRRKFGVGANFRNGYEEVQHKPRSAAGVSDVPVKADYLEPPKLSGPVEVTTKRWPIPPPFDLRKFLIEKARSDIKIRLEQMEAARQSVQVAAAIPKADSEMSGRVSKQHKTGPVSITVPDPDFHDFDKDRSEECFTPKQIWALYDEDDGMPRLYCLIREVVSVKPFKILITYLNSKTDTEFGSMNWIGHGFTKSCGHFRAWSSDTVDQVNVFSHLLKGQKAGRGGCVRIFPRCGEIWAVYRNWSQDWNGSTPDDVRHQYEMVEVVDDYFEDRGVCVAPLVKMAGFKTVYQRDSSQDVMKWIPRAEMFRFSHQVPSWSLNGRANNDLPNNCWDLDPAATPDDLLHTATITTEAPTEEAKA